VHARCEKAASAGELGRWEWNEKDMRLLLPPLAQLTRLVLGTPWAAPVLGHQPGVETAVEQLDRCMVMK
jgi:hypothetical protein